MSARHSSHWSGFVVAVLLLGGVAFAQTPQTTDPVQQPYKPVVGQEGKDVVWVPSPQALVEKMLDMAAATPRDFLIDLGSGDGITVITAAKRGIRAHGIEYNPELVELSKIKAGAEGVGHLATFAKADIFESDFSEATVITMFLLPSLNLRLRSILLDLKPGTRIVSNTFDMDDWEPEERIPRTDDCESWCSALMWIIPAKVEGTWQLGPQVQGQPGPEQQELTFVQKYQTLTGKLGSASIGGKLRGNEITFAVGGVLYTGRVDGAFMRGTMIGGAGGAWSATRK
jgi:hypothetical protein